MAPKASLETSLRLVDMTSLKSHKYYPANVFQVCNSGWLVLVPFMEKDWLQMDTTLSPTNALLNLKEPKKISRRKEWYRPLPFTLFTHREALHRSTGVVSYELMYGEVA